jgi:hypothetical protein
VSNLGRLAGAVVVGLGAVGLGLWYFVGSDSPNDSATKEAAKVYCLSGKHHAELSEAAKNLGVSVSANQSFDDQHPEFDRVCTAVTGAARVPQPASPASAASPKSTLTVLTPVIVGAALTFFVGFWRDERTQSRLLAETLRTVARKYFSAARAQRAKWFEPRQGLLAVDQAVLDSRDELLGQLRKVSILRRGWRVPGRLHQAFSSRSLGEGMNDLAPGQTARERDQAHNQELHHLSNGVDDVVRALERPWHWHREMRKKSTPAGKHPRRRYRAQDEPVPGPWAGG